VSTQLNLLFASLVVRQSVGLFSGDSLGYRDWAESCGQTGQRNCTPPPRGVDLQLRCQGHDPGSRSDCHVTNDTSAGSNTRSPGSDTSDSIRYYHVITVGVVSFLIGAITSFVILIHCCQSRTVPQHKHAPADAAAAAAVTKATAEERRRRDVIVTSQGGVATLETTVIERAGIGDGKTHRRMTAGDDVFSAASSSNSSCRPNGTTTRSALLNLTQYYRRHRYY